MPLPCGNDSVYCPGAQGAPLLVSAGYYASAGAPGARTDRTECPPGQYCPGDGHQYNCNGGHYGNTTGLTTPACSGRCLDGVLCEPGETSPDGQRCPPGAFCLAGVSVECPAGTYNNDSGAKSMADCLLCPAGKYGGLMGMSSEETACLPCPAFENSFAGARACWPGLQGVLGG